MGPCRAFPGQKASLCLRAAPSGVPASESSLHREADGAPWRGACFLRRIPAESVCKHMACGHNPHVQGEEEGGFGLTVKVALHKQLPPFTFFFSKNVTENSFCFCLGAWTLRVCGWPYRDPRTGLWPGVSVLWGHSVLSICRVPGRS